MNIQRSFPPVVPRPARFDSDAYFQLAPVLQANFVKTELRDGVIYDMPADGSLTTLWNSEISNWLYRTIGNDFLVVTDKSLRLGDDWVPSPDHYVAESVDVLEDTLPEKILLVIEVSDSTLESDLGVKAVAYAENGIREYWVIDPKDKRLYAHHLREDGTYGEPTQVGFTDSITAKHITGLTLRMADLPRIS